MQFATRIASLRGTRSAATALALLLGVAPALAQTAPAPTAPAAPAQPRPAQPRPAAPAAQPAAPPAQAAPPANVQTIQLKGQTSQDEWIKACGKDPANNEVCFTSREFVSDQGQPVLSVAVYEVKSPQAPKIVRFMMPQGLSLPPGVRFAVDQGQLTPGRFTLCAQNVCVAEAQVRDELVNVLKKGNSMNLMVQDAAGREIAFAFPVAGFGKAFDGPPIDPKVLEEQQRKLQEELQKRSDEMRKRLEQQSGAAGAGAPAAAPTAAASPATPRPGVAPTAPRP